MLSNKEKYNILEGILKSKTFSKTTTSSVLLKILVDATIQEKELSAFTIGLELLGKNFDQDKIEVNTRVNIYHLRKKLKSYYQTEGRNDPIYISIEPGQYQVSFLPRESTSQRNKYLKISIALVSILVLLILKPYIFKEKTIWTPILENKHSTTLFLGEVFGYTGKTPFSERGWLRDFHINSAEDLYALTRENPEEYANYTPAGYNYVVLENALLIKPFTHFFTTMDYDFSIRKSSDFDIKNIKNKNTIFAGPLFINSPFNEIFNDYAKNVKLTTINIPRKSYTFNYKNRKNSIDTTIFIGSKDNKHEYAIASGFKGPNNTMHYIFFSNHGMGLNAVVDFLTNSNSLEEFSKEYLKDSEEFVALFFVTGKDRTSLDMELIVFDDNK